MCAYIIKINRFYGICDFFDFGGVGGGGLKTGQAGGTTYELGKTIHDHPVSIPDLHATICQAMRVNPAKELYDGIRPVPITDNGRAISRVFG